MAPPNRRLEKNMANTPQAKKRIRSNERKAEINKSRVSRMRTFIRQVEDAITAGDKSAAADALKAAQPEIMRGVTKGVIHKKTASRKVSRLAARVNAIA
jgi:small subunit ribosomal protein S20